MCWPVAAARKSLGEAAAESLSTRRVLSRPLAAGAAPTTPAAEPVPSPPRPSAKAIDVRLISPLCLSSVLSPAIPSSLRNMSAFGPPACDGVEKLLSGADEVSVGPLAEPGSPWGPGGPAGPVGPVWLHVSGVSPAAQVWVASSMIRTAPGGVLAGLMQAWMVPSADGIAATATAAPAPRAATVGRAKRSRKRRDVGAIGRH